jgi:hypothetical protein
VKKFVFGEFAAEDIYWSDWRASLIFQAY